MSQQVKKIGIAVIGYGYWSPNLIRNIQKNPNFDLKVICEKDESRHEKIRSDVLDVEVMRHYKDVFLRKDIDAVVIATIASSHFRIAKAALLAHKHVLIEKPMATSISDAKELIILGKKMKKVVMVDHTFLYAPAVVRLKEIIDSGALGDICSVTSTRVNMGLFQRDINVLWDLGPHDFSILYYLLNKEPKYISAFGTIPVEYGSGLSSQEAIVHVTLHFSKVLNAHSHLSWLAPKKERLVVVVGTEKMVVYNLMDKEGQLRVYNQKVVMKSTENGSNPVFEYNIGDSEIVPVDTSKEDLGYMITDFRDSILEQKDPRSSGEFGLCIVKMLVAAQKSIERDGDKVLLDTINTWNFNLGKLLRM